MMMYMKDSSSDAFVCCLGMCNFVYIRLRYVYIRLRYVYIRLDTFICVYMLIVCVRPLNVCTFLTLVFDTLFCKKS